MYYHLQSLVENIPKRTVDHIDHTSWDLETVTRPKTFLIAADAAIKRARLLEFPEARMMAAIVVSEELVRRIRSRGKMSDAQLAKARKFDAIACDTIKTELLSASEIQLAEMVGITAEDSSIGEAVRALSYRASVFKTTHPRTLHS